MADPYSSVSISGYNTNPPADDGSQTEANRVKWATIKTKLNDPVKTRTDDMDTALIAAFGKIDGGVTSTAISYTVLSTDQGKLVRASAGGITITTPDATDVDAPFVFGVLNDSTSDITLDGSGSQTVDGDASVTIPAGAGCRVRTDGTNWFTEGQNFARTLTKPQGYLTLISVATQPTSPVVSSDQTAKTSVFYRPDAGNLLPIPDGTNFAVREFSELTLTLVASHAASSILDVFAWSEAGVITIGTGPAWTTATAGSGARGTGAGTTELDLLKGLLVNKVSMAARNGSTTYTVGAKCGIYLGSLFMDGTNGQISCHVSFGQSRKWGVWNAYNQRDINLLAGDSTASWTYGTNTVRASRNDSTNSLTIFSGLPVSSYDVSHAQFISGSMANGQTLAAVIGIGVNSTSSLYPQRNGSISSSNATGATYAVGSTIFSNAKIPPAIGINVITALENGGGGSGTTTFNGGSGNQMLSAVWAG